MKKQARRKAAITYVVPSEISPAAELIASNVDLLTEILLRLPLKSTIQFQSVSKHWLSLISDSQFATNHNTRNPSLSTISGLYFNNQETLHFVSLHGRRHNLPSLSFLNGLGEQSTTIRVAHSCNGLLLCYISHIYGYFWQFIVCNPTTKKYTLLPKPDGLVKGWSGCLVFDPSKSPHHYKVILVDYSPGRYGSPYRIDVYSSQSLCWRKVVSPENGFFGSGVFWNGAIHWLTYDDFLSRFDFDVEEIIAIRNPQSPKIISRDKTMYFGECGGGLILIQSHLYCPSGLRILEMKRDYSGWVVNCRVNLRPVIYAFPEMKSRTSYSHGFRVLGAMKGENGRGFALVLALPGRIIISYNSKSKTWDVLRDLVPGKTNAIVWHSSSVPFIETFFPV